MKYCRTK